jgi:hypothetical protein
MPGDTLERYEALHYSQRMHSLRVVQIGRTS